MDKVHVASAASVPAALLPEPTIGQALEPVPFSVKFVAMEGLLPEVGIGKLSVAFPLFHTVTVLGLSLLVEPAAVVAKLRLGGSETSIFSSASTERSPM
jgi:hypothetical protein